MNCNNDKRNAYKLFADNILIVVYHRLERSSTGWWSYREPFNSKSSCAGLPKGKLLFPAQLPLKCGRFNVRKPHVTTALAGPPISRRFQFYPTLLWLHYSPFVHYRQVLPSLYTFLAGLCRSDHF